MKSALPPFASHLCKLLLCYHLAASTLLCVNAQEAISPTLNLAGVQPVMHNLTMIEAINLADRNFPSIKAAMYHQQAANAGVERARTAYLPKGNLLLQETRATSNNITGPMFPNAVVPNISGGVKGNRNDMTGGWGSAFGTLVSWEPFDFGLRKAKVHVAQSQTAEAAAQVAVTRLDVESSAADDFLKALAEQQAVRAAQAKVDRFKVFVQTVHVLVQQDLRPTTDEYVAQAEFAKAEDELTNAEQAFELALAQLGRSVGLVNCELTLDSGPLLHEQPVQTPPAHEILTHPMVLAQAAAVEVSHAKKKVIEKTYYPQINLLGAAFARGSSFRTDISVDESKGFYPQKFNYAAGIGITFPYLDFFELRAEHKIAARLEQEQRANYDLTILNLQSQNAEARALMKAALKIAANAPVKVKAATEAERSVKIRYEHGLASVNDVAQDEELLTRSQVDYATAQLRVWRSLLAASIAQGDIKPFINQVSNLSAGGR